MCWLKLFFIVAVVLFGIYIVVKKYKSIMANESKLIDEKSNEKEEKKETKTKKGK